jgi:DNA-binding SARP family transcriptional activator
MSPDGSFGFSIQPRVVVYTLGRLELVIDGQAVRFKGRAPLRALELLSALIAAGGRGASVGGISDQLWPDADGFDAYRAFTTTLHRLRRLLGFHDAVRLSAGQLMLDPQICHVDVWGFERALRAARDDESLDAALDLYRGPFLGDDPNPWAIAMRARLEKLIAQKKRAWDAPRDSGSGIRGQAWLPTHLRLVASS